MPSNISSYSKEFNIFTPLQAPAIPRNVASYLESRSLRSPLCFLRASCAHFPILESLSTLDPGKAAGAVVVTELVPTKIIIVHVH